MAQWVTSATKDGPRVDSIGYAITRGQLDAAGFSWHRTHRLSGHTVPTHAAAVMHPRCDFSLHIARHRSILIGVLDAVSPSGIWWPMNKASHSALPIAADGDGVYQHAARGRPGPLWEMKNTSLMPAAPCPPGEGRWIGRWFTSWAITYACEKV